MPGNLLGIINIMPMESFPLISKGKDDHQLLTLNHHIILYQ